MGRTYVILDGIRRSKAAELCGWETIWAPVGASARERKIAIRSLLSPKAAIDVREPRQMERWLSIKNGIAQEPDLLPPIIIRAGTRGTPIAQVRVIE